MGWRSRRDTHRSFVLIFVDTSVWIDHFRGQTDRPHVQALRRFVDDSRTIIVGDLVLLEILSGAKDESRTRRLELGLRSFGIATMLDDRLAVLAARNYRALRALGVTIRRSNDVIIGTYCLDHDFALLHNDRDFEPMHDRLGLRPAIKRP